ncbi:MAG: glycoside hydrolase family 16 protein [Treponema sp.]|jgi:beta-glucanase (GH16 family)|nr:glycoside hydrolase family 16 protein [Treponema sp.]
MNKNKFFPMTAAAACFVFLAVVSCNSMANSGLGGKLQILSPEVYTIKTPQAGNYPQGLYKYPYRGESLADELFTQTLKWEPAVHKTFDKDTQYTAILKLDPADRKRTFKELSVNDVKGLPTDGVTSITAENENDSLVIKIVFEKTAETNAEAKIIFSDEFDGNSLDQTKWGLCPEWDRQGRSSWRDDMVSVSGGLLRIKLTRDPALGKTKSGKKEVRDNWIRTGGIRTQKKDRYTLFDNSFGFYEARIKFPKVEGTWGAFWLMSPTQHILTDVGIIGTEIDIVETIENPKNAYNAALHWNGYGDKHKSTGSDSSKLPAVNIYDGEFHTFAVDWSPSEYVFYVDGEIFWRVDGGAKFNNSGINQNPNYIKLTVESAEWAGKIPANFTEDEMLVDYVRVYNQPRY